MDSQSKFPKETLEYGIEKERKKFEECYQWVEQHMPASFFEEMDEESLMLIVHNLMSFNLNDFFSHIHLKNLGFTLCLDSPDADLKVLKHYKMFGIKNYRSFTSNAPPPFPGVKKLLRISMIVFKETQEKQSEDVIPLGKEILKKIQERNPQVTEPDLHKLITELNSYFLRSLPQE
ncbi:MAG: glutamate dehydrogenase, partial [Chlamydiae bacterium]